VPRPLTPPTPEQYPQLRQPLEAIFGTISLDFSRSSPTRSNCDQPNTCRSRHGQALLVRERLRQRSEQLPSLRNDLHRQSIFIAVSGIVSLSCFSQLNLGSARINFTPAQAVRYAPQRYSALLTTGLANNVKDLPRGNAERRACGCLGHSAIA
jgi:hypothetical protein